MANTIDPVEASVEITSKADIQQALTALDSIIAKLTSSSEGVTKFESSMTMMSTTSSSRLSSFASSGGSALAMFGNQITAAARNFTNFIDGIVNSIPRALSSIQQMITASRDMQNASGGTTVDPGFQLVNQRIGSNPMTQLFNNIAVSNIMKSTADVMLRMDIGATNVAAKFDHMNVAISSIDVNHLEALTRATEDLAKQQRNLEEGRADFQDTELRNSTRRSNDFNETSIRAETDKNEQLNKLFDAYIEHKKTTEDELKKKGEDNSAKIVNEEEGLQKKLYDIQKSYGDQRLSLYDRYFNANPLLRPFIKSQIDELATLQSQQENLAKTDAEVKIAKLRAENAVEIKVLIDKLAEIKENRDRDEADILKSFTRRMDDLRKGYERQVEDANIAQKKETRQYQQHQADLLNIFDRRITDENENYAKALDDRAYSFANASRHFTDKIDVMPTMEAFNKLGLSVKEMNDMLESGNITGFWQKFTEAYAKLPNDAQKITVLKQAFGGMANGLKPVLDELVSLGSTGVDSLSKLFPSYTEFTKQTTTNVKALYEWNTTLGIGVDVFDRFLLNLIGPAEKLGKSIQSWYEKGGREELYVWVDKISGKLKTIISDFTDLVDGKISFDDFLKNTFKVKDGDSLFGDFYNSLVGYFANSFAKFADDTKVSAAIRESGRKLGEGIIKGMRDAILGKNVWENLSAESDSSANGSSKSRTVFEDFKIDGKSHKAIVDSYKDTAGAVRKVVTTWIDDDEKSLKQRNTTFGTSGEELKSDTVTLYDSIQKGISSTYQGIELATTNHTNAIKGIYQSSNPDLEDTMNMPFDHAKAGMLTFNADTLLSAILGRQNTINGINGSNLDLFNALANPFATFAGWLLTDTSTKSAATTWTGTIIAGIKEAFKDWNFWDFINQIFSSSSGNSGSNTAYRGAVGNARASSVSVGTVNVYLPAGSSSAQAADLLNQLTRITG